MLKKLMQRLGRYRVIMDREDDEPYLERYYIFLKDRRWFPFNMFIHKFLKSDPGQVHDHPWPYCTIILRGGYWEWTPILNQAGRQLGERVQWKGAGQIRFGHSTDYHRIELEPGVTPWTLFIPGPKLREWGFLVGHKWVPHDEYFEQHKE
jgi:hypothetical protein